MSVEECQEWESSRGFSEWLAYASLEPFGSEVHYYSAAMIIAALYNLFKKPDAEPYSPADFMPNFEPVDSMDEEPDLREEIPEDIYDLFKTWAILNGAQHVDTSENGSQITTG